MATNKKKNIKVSDGIVHISATFNNTIITLTDKLGNTLGWSSAGAVGYKGSRKSSPYAAQLVGSEICKQIEEFGMTNIDIKVKGPGSGREAAIRSMNIQGIKIGNITDVTPLPHNGCRQPKKRRG